MGLKITRSCETSLGVAPVYLTDKILKQIAN